MNCIKNERIKKIMYKNERIKNEIIKNERIKNELIKKRTDSEFTRTSDRRSSTLMYFSGLLIHIHFLRIRIQQFF